MRGIVFALGATMGVTSPIPASGQTRAEPPRSDAAPTPPAEQDVPSGALPEPQQASVELVVIGSAEQLSRVQGVVAAWRLGDRRLNWRRAERFESSAWFGVQSGPELRCVVDLTRGRQVRLYFVNGRTQRYMVRSLEISGRLDELDREALGQAIELSLLALLDDRAAGLSRADAESLFVPPPTARLVVKERPPVEDPRRFEADLTYQVLPMLDELPLTHGPGAELAFAVVHEPRLAVSASGQYRVADTWEHPLAEVELEAAALRVGLELAPALHRWGTPSSFGDVRLALRLNAGVDWLTLHPMPGERTRDAEATAERRRVEPVLGASAQTRVVFSGSFSVRLGALLDVAPERVRYEVALDGERATVFRSLRFRPGAIVAIGTVW